MMLFSVIIKKVPIICIRIVDSTKCKFSAEKATLSLLVVPKFTLPLAGQSCVQGLTPSPRCVPTSLYY